MLNHVRTLLMNRGRDGVPRDYPGEEYVSPTYIPRRLTAPLQRGCQLLFGTRPDRLFLNYRMRQIMQLLHATELRDYVLTFDRRVTYLPFLANDFFDSVFSSSVRQVGGEVRQLFLNDSALSADENIGRAEFAWRVVASEQHTTLVQKGPQGFTTEVVPIFERQLSEPITLPGTVATVRFNQPDFVFSGGDFGDDFNDDFAIGDTLAGGEVYDGYGAFDDAFDGAFDVGAIIAAPKWEIVTRKRPTKDFSIVLSQLPSALGESGLEQLFPLGAAEPVKTFFNVWSQHEVSAYRYAALLLAMAWKINELPQVS